MNFSLSQERNKQNENQTKLSEANVKHHVFLGHI